jgi:predicted Rossmann fold flavoprotein
MNNESYDVCVIGGGAAGMMAAIKAARDGASVIILEKMNRPGRKLSITGKGRCNLTNIAPLSEFLEHTGPDPKFLRNAFSVFFTKELLDFMEVSGVKTVTERGGRVFPESEQAKEIVDAFTHELNRLKVRIAVNNHVSRIVISNGSANGVELKDRSFVQARKIILATGGSSYAGTGSTGDGYRLAADAGHSVRKPIPALVPFVTEGDVAEELQGLALKNVKASVYIENKKAGDAFGEMLFAHFGLTGPIILTLSRQFGRDILEGKKAEISIDLKPALDDQTLDKRLLRELDEHGKMQVKSILRTLLPGSMVQVCCRLLELDADKLGNQVSSAERKKLRVWLKNFRFKINGMRGFDEAIITSGGISTKEIDPRTMESKLIKNLYFAGEVIDLDADTGGYNLQIAFSTGWVAGKACSAGLQEQHG